MAPKSVSKSPVSQQRIGLGGELHQIAAEGQPRLTTNQGHIVADDQNSLRAGQTGSTLL